MERLNFYKEMYIREHDLKHKLDEKVTVPTAIITLMVSIHVYFFSHAFEGILMIIVKYNAVFAGGSVAFALFYLGQSFMNLGKTHTYRELAAMNDFRNYDIQLKQSEREKEYEEHLEKEFADCATVNRSVNIYRTERLANCKIALFVALIATFINSLVYTLGILLE